MVGGRGFTARCSRRYILHHKPGYGDLRYPSEEGRGHFAHYPVDTQVLITWTPPLELVFAGEVGEGYG